MKPMKLFSCATLIAAALGIYGCASDGPLNTIKSKITCHDVCQRYADCYDKNYDVSGCTDKCTNDATATSQKEDELNTCNDCIGPKSCTSATFNCATDCAQFVP